MPAHKFMDYLRAVAPIEAKESMLMAEAVTYPHLNKKEDRKRFWRSKRLAIDKAVEKPRQGLKSYKDVVANLARKIRG